MKRFEEEIQPSEDRVDTTMMGFEVNKPFKILIKILNATEYIELNIQNIKCTKNR